jgi:hypothetical protein
MSVCCLTPNEQYEERCISKNKNTNLDKEDTLANHKLFMSSLNIPINEENCELSTLYWIPKFQRNQYLDRYSSLGIYYRQIRCICVKTLQNVHGSLL